MNHKTPPIKSINDSFTSQIEKYKYQIKKEEVLKKAVDMFISCINSDAHITKTVRHNSTVTLVLSEEGYFNSERLTQLFDNELLLMNQFLVTFGTAMRALSKQRFVYIGINDDVMNSGDKSSVRLEILKARCNTELIPHLNKYKLKLIN